jgi:hypothetical protein
MSLLSRAKEITGGLADTSKRQAQRGKLEIEVRRLEGKINDEKAAIGEAGYPLLEAGTLVTDAPGVGDHLATIKTLLADIEAKRAEIDELKSGTDDDGDDSSGEAGTPVDPLSPPSDASDTATTTPTA